MEKREPSYTVDGNVNWYKHYGKQYGVSSKKLQTELPYDPAVLLLGIYSKKMKALVQKDICMNNVHYSIIYNNQDMEAT